MIKILYGLPAIAAIIIIFVFLVRTAGDGSVVMAPVEMTRELPSVETVFSNEISRTTIDNQIVIEEAPAPEKSIDMFWWVDSGAYAFVRDGFLMTVSGRLPPNDKWRLKYLESNSLDTDNGYCPQNIFRLVSRKKWQDFTEEAYLMIKKYNASPSPNRAESNGLILMGRYVDGNNLYYAGIRVDGKAIIKRKYNGAYRTLAETFVFAGGYDRDFRPNLLPENRWLGLRMTVKNEASDQVRIRLDVDKSGQGDWQTVLETVDTAKNNRLRAISRLGIRTDFMDVIIKNFSVSEL